VADIVKEVSAADPIVAEVLEASQACNGKALDCLNTTSLPASSDLRYFPGSPRALCPLDAKTYAAEIGMQMPRTPRTLEELYHL